MSKNMNDCQNESRFSVSPDHPHRIAIASPKKMGKKKTVPAQKSTIAHPNPSKPSKNGGFALPGTP